MELVVVPAMLEVSLLVDMVRNKQEDMAVHNKQEATAVLELHKQEDMVEVLNEVDMVVVHQEEDTAVHRQLVMQADLATVHLLAAISNDKEDIVVPWLELVMEWRTMWTLKKSKYQQVGP